MLIKQRNFSVNRQGVNIAMWCIRGDLLGIRRRLYIWVCIGDYRYRLKRLGRHRRLYRWLRSSRLGRDRTPYISRDRRL